MKEYEFSFPAFLIFGKKWDRSHSYLTSMG